MSQDSTPVDLAELTRRGFEILDDGDVDAFLGFFAPGAVFEMMDLGSRVAGVSAIRGFIEDWHRAYEGPLAFEVKEILILENGVVFAVHVTTGRLVGSMSDVRMRTATVALWAEGRIAQVTFYTDIDDARAAAERLSRDRESATTGSS